MDTPIRITEDWRRDFDGQTGNWNSVQVYTLHYADGGEAYVPAVPPHLAHLLPPKPPVAIQPAVLSAHDMDRATTVTAALKEAARSRWYAMNTMEPQRSYHRGMCRAWIAWARGLRKVNGNRRAA